ncbi:hypothetical protein HAX54_020315, partial [Datura stramonium]|nr:hypothetical protein [Datura stramonium]
MGVRVWGFRFNKSELKSSDKVDKVEKAVIGSLRRSQQLLPHFATTGLRLLLWSRCSGNPTAAT